MATPNYDLEVKTEIQRRLKEAVHYNNWIYSQFEPFLGRRVLEVGCSIGNFTEKLVERTERMIALDVIPEYTQTATDRFGHFSHFTAYHMDICDPKILTWVKDERIDTIICQNVLEHIEDDITALRHMYQLLVPGGHLILLVPALQMIYGTMDAADDHFRRYNKSMARTRLEATGFKIDTIYYMNFPGFFGWFFNGRILKRKVLPANQLANFDRIVPLVAGLERIMHPPFGQSLFVISTK